MVSLLAWSENAPDFAALSILALVQGLTEFLPISSSGHLVLAQQSMNWSEPALVLDVALHVGTLAAVVLVYRADLLALVSGLLRGRWREPLQLVVASVPAAVVGLVFLEHLESVFHGARAAAGGLFATAAILLVGEWARRHRGSEEAPDEEVRAEEPEPELGWGQALFIGTAQAFAIWPGISRSGSTIAAGMLCGLAPARAARFSFLLSIPAILGAAVLQLPDALDEGLPGGAGPLLWATVFAGFVGWGALRVLLAFLGRGAFAWFAAYCIGLGTGAFLFATS